MLSLLDQIERVPVGSLEFYPGNPRRGNVQVIAESLRENAQYAPIVAQRSTRYVLAGNHTLRAAKSLGWPEIDVVFVDVDDTRARKILLSSNRTSDVATDDPDALAELLSYLDDDYDGTGWSAEDVAKLIEPLPPPGDAPTGDDMPVTWGVIVECADEIQQTGLLRQLSGDGWKVRALMT
jgi:ParB family chromosome partitioning protein